MKIFDSRKSIVMASMGVLFATLALVSCEKREEPLLNDMAKYSKTVVFTEQQVQTRATAYINYSTQISDADYVLRAEESTDSMFLSAYVTDLESEQLMTRATETTTENLGQFRILAYNVGSDNSLRINEGLSQLVDKNRDGTWSYGAVDGNTEKYWSDLGTNNIKFYAYANLSQTFIRNEGLPQTQFELTLPTNSNAQTDIVVAKGEITDAEGNTQDVFNSSFNAQVPLKFNHICAGIRFVVGNREVEGELEQIRLINMISSAVYDLTTNSWNEAGGAEATLTVDNVTTKTSITLPDGTLATQVGSTLMVIPQTIDNDDEVMFEVVFKVTNPTDANDDGRRVFNIKLPAGFSWSAGNMYTYKISNSQINYLEFAEHDKPVDAHYIIDSVMINVKAGVTTCTLTSNVAGVQFRATEPIDYEKRGYWIDNNDLGVTITNEGISETFPKRNENSITWNATIGIKKIYVFIPENASSADRKITLTLTGTGTNVSIKPRTLTITQYCPTSTGCERIEEDQDLQWGPYWKSANGGDVVFTYDMTNVEQNWEYWSFRIRGWFVNYVPSLAERWGWDIDGVSYKFTWALGELQSVTVDLGNYCEYTMSLNDNGLENTKNIYFGMGNDVDLSEVLEVLNSLNSLAGSSNNADIEEVKDIEGTALLQALKKNKYSLEVVESGGDETVNLYLKRGTSADGNVDNVKWYLPSISELPNQLNSMNGLSGTTPSGTYWSSTTSTDNPESHSRVYNYDTKTEGPEGHRKDNRYNLRAARVVDWN